MIEGTDRIEEARPRRFRPYPAYKDSGVEWLGEVPAHWAVYPLRRRLFREAGSIKIGPFGSDLKLEFMVQEGFKVYGQEHAISRDFSRGSKYVDEPKFTELAACEIRPRDLVVTMMGSSGRCAVVPEDIERGIMDSHLLRLRLPDSELDPSFLALLIDRADYIRDQIQAAGKGAIMHGLNSSIVKGIVMAVPPTAEQPVILDFLDHETAKIDGLVARKERLIELLQEKRTALITRAATRGLDPNVPMKNSGVEWLGEIPAHWRVGKLKHACERVFVGIAEAATFAYVDEGVPMLRSTDVRANRVRTEDIRCIDIAFADRLASKQLRTDDIITVRTGNAGVSAVVPPAYDGGQCFTLVVSRPTKVNDSRYFCYWLNARPGQEQFRVEGLGTAQVNISVPIVQNAVVCIPPREEQVQIANWIEQEVTRWNCLMDRISRAIDHLREFRTALISAAVTGKIDVREAVPL